MVRNHGPQSKDGYIRATPSKEPITILLWKTTNGSASQVSTMLPSKPNRQFTLSDSQSMILKKNCCILARRRSFQRKPSQPLASTLHWHLSPLTWCSLQILLSQSWFTILPISEIQKSMKLQFMQFLELAKSWTEDIYWTLMEFILEPIGWWINSHS